MDFTLKIFNKKGIVYTIPGRAAKEELPSERIKADKRVTIAENHFILLPLLHLPGKPESDLRYKGSFQRTGFNRIKDTAAGICSIILRSGAGSNIYFIKSISMTGQNQKIYYNQNKGSLYVNTI